MTILGTRRMALLKRHGATIMIIVAALASSAALVLAGQQIIRESQEKMLPKQEVLVCFATQDIAAGEWVTVESVVDCKLFTRNLAPQELQQAVAGENTALAVRPTPWEVNNSGQTMALVNIKAGQMVDGSMFTAQPPVEEPQVLTFVSLQDYPGAGLHVIYKYYPINRESEEPVTFAGYSDVSGILFRGTCYQVRETDEGGFPIGCLMDIKNVFVIGPNGEYLASITPDMILTHLADIARVTGHTVWITRYPPVGQEFTLFVPETRVEPDHSAPEVPTDTSEIPASPTLEALPSSTPEPPAETPTPPNR